MNNKLAMEFDDHEWTLIVTSLRRDAMRMRNTSAVFNYNLAFRIEEAVEDYQNEGMRHLSFSEVAATSDVLDRLEDMKQAIKTGLDTTNETLEAMK